MRQNVCTWPAGLAVALLSMLIFYREHPRLRYYFLNRYRQELDDAQADRQPIPGTHNALLKHAAREPERGFPELQKRLPDMGSPLPG